jgi:hypothetical protein
VVVVVVEVVVDDVVVVVVGLGLVVVGAVEDEALGRGRVGSGSEVWLGAPLGRDVVVGRRVPPPVATSARLPPTAAGLPLRLVAVGPATPAPGSTVSWPTPTG